MLVRMRRSIHETGRTTTNAEATKISAIAVARGAGCPLEISHLKCEGQRNWGKLDAVFARIADARKSGTDVTFDCYPYLAFSTGLTNLFPPSSRDGGNAAFFARLTLCRTLRAERGMYPGRDGSFEALEGEPREVLHRPQ